MIGLRRQIEEELALMHPNDEERRECRRCSELMDIVHEEAIQEDNLRFNRRLGIALEEVTP
jgi:hypothetical protein